MPYRQIDPKKSASAIEKEILDFWEREHIFKKSVESRDREFIFYEGPPTANGKPGIHHLMARTIKDIVCRYKTMVGFSVKRKAGWDTHGLPVEIEVQKNLNLDDRKKIIEYGVKKFNKKCRESVFDYERQWRQMTRLMGYWIDMDNPYITLENNYIESVWWILNNFFERGLIYKGYKIVPYCPKCGTPLSSHEVSLGYRDVLDPSVFVKFKKKGEENTYFLAWTTTPWTLISNVALAVNPREEYQKISLNGENLILAKKLVDKLCPDAKVVSQMYGNELEYEEYEQLFDFITPSKKAFYIVLADYVSMEDGTGIVHTAPAFGADDYSTSLKYSLPIINPVDEEGKFTKQIAPWQGVFVKDADKDIIRNLKKRGILFRRDQIKHSYPFCWRCSSPLIYYARNSWFIKTTEFRDKLIEQNKSINWVPRFVGEGRFGMWLKGNVDWAISRDRFWGTPLNIWICCDCGKKKSVGSISELKHLGKRKNGEPVDNDIELHKPYVDDIVLNCANCRGVMERTAEVIDCWFDSGAMPFAQLHYPFENSQSLEKKHFPADFICEGIDQTRGWFYSLLAISVLLTGKTPYKNVLVNDLILDKTGQKMSKSVGNVVDPFLMMDRFGADALRWYLIAVSPPWVPTKFDEAGVIEVQNKFFGTIKNIYSFFATYANIDKLQIEPKKLQSISRTLEIDRWIISRVNSLIKSVKTSYDEYDLTKVVRAVADFVVEDLSNWYVRRTRRRFWEMTLTKSKLDAFYTLYETLVKVLQIAAPVAPFLTDSLFLSLTGEKSVHLSDFPKYDKKLIDKQLEKRMDTAVQVVSLGRAARNNCDLKVRQTLSQIVVEKDLKPLIEDMEDQILSEVNVKEIIYSEPDDNFFEYSAKANFKRLGPRYGKRVKDIAKYLKTGDINRLKKSLETGKSLHIKFHKEQVKLTSEDVIFSLKQKDGYEMVKAKGICLALNKTLTQDLIDEGFAREIINKVQFTRKDNNFEIMDRIKVFCHCNKELTQAIKKNIEYIKQETLSDDVIFTQNSDKMKLWDINSEKLWLRLEKS